MTYLTVIGIGDVVRNRYISALKTEIIRNDLRITNLIDIKPKSEILSDSKQKLLSKSCFYQLPDTNPETLLSLLEEKGLSDQPVLIATPTKFHVPYATKLLQAGISVAIEKPYAVNFKDINIFDTFVCKNGLRNVFLFSYYLLEKGLPLFAISKGKEIHPAYLPYLTPSVGINQLAQIRAALGEIKNIYGVLLEGIGSSGSLQHRPWVLDPTSGGNTLETFYHIMSLIIPFIKSSKPVKIEEVNLAIHKKTKHYYKENYGSQPAETLTCAKIRINEICKARLICGKYVSPEAHQRWIAIEFEKGRLFADLEEKKVIVYNNVGILKLNLKYKEKYVTQFCLFRDHLSNPKAPVEYKLLRNALELTLELRDIGLRNPIHEYSESDVNQYYIEEYFERKISELI